MNKDIKIIRHNANGINEPDDLSYPFRLDATLRPPEFMKLAFLLLYGNEELSMLGKTQEALDKAVESLGIKGHPRLIKMTVTER